MSEQPTIVLVHGAWFGAWVWTPLIHHLTAAGRTAVAVDLLGHGLDARRPASARARPFDPQAFAEEPSPVGGVTLDAAVGHLAGQVRLLGRGERVVVVAHSMGGTVLTGLAQRAPDLLAHAVYLCAFMPGSGTPAATYSTSPDNADSPFPSGIRGDPAVSGAVRFDTGSPEEEYRAALVRSLFADLPARGADAALALLGCDQPLGYPTGATMLSADGFGRVPRTYVHTAQDWTIRPRLQRRMVAEIDAAFPDQPTRTVELEASHSPMLSMPEQVAEILIALP